MLSLIVTDVYASLRLVRLTAGVIRREQDIPKLPSLILL